MIGGAAETVAFYGETRLSKLPDHCLIAGWCKTTVNITTDHSEKQSSSTSDIFLAMLAMLACWVDRKPNPVALKRDTEQAATWSQAILIKLNLSSLLLGSLDWVVVFQFEQV